MALPQAGMRVRRPVSARAPIAAVVHRHLVLARRVRYHLYRIAGTVMLVAGAWAG